MSYTSIDNWLIYVKHSYSIVQEAEAKLCVNLEHTTEAYMVHLFARYLDNPHINTEPVCIRLMQGMNLPRHQKRLAMTLVADECLLISGLELSKTIWPSLSYYTDLGRMAYDELAYTEIPADKFYKNLATNFILLSAVLNECRAM
jgi:hypothetical protein